MCFNGASGSIFVDRLSACAKLASVQAPSLPAASAESTTPGSVVSPVRPRNFARRVPKRANERCRSDDGRSLTHTSLGALSFAMRTNAINAHLSSVTFGELL